jgi:hypothetical protein
MNDFGFTVDNPGAAQSVTVTVAVSDPANQTPPSGGPENLAVLERQDPADGPWSALSLVVASRYFGPDTGSYQLDLPAEATTTEHLRVNPLGSTTFGSEIAVTLGGSGVPTVEQSKTVSLVEPTIASSGPSSVTPGSTQDFDFTITNNTSGAYTGIQLSLTAYGTTPACDVLPFATAEWSDGGAMQQATFTSGSQWDVLTTVLLAPGQSRQIAVQLPVPSSLASCLTGGDVALDVQELGGGAGFPVSGTGPQSPSIALRGDVPFAIS